MMKATKVPLVVTVVAILASCQTTEPIPPGEETVSYVTEAPGISARDAYSRSLQWAAQTFVSAQDVLQLTDEERQRIVGRGAMQVDYGGLVPLRTEFLFTIEHREGRARIELAQPFVDDRVGNTPVSGAVGDRRAMDKFRVEAMDLITDWEAFITSAGTQRDDW